MKLPITGALIYLQGGKPITDFLQGQLDISETGCLVVDREYQTGIPGVLAVGDVLCNHVKQAVVAADEGAVVWPLPDGRTDSGLISERAGWQVGDRQGEHR